MLTADQLRHDLMTTQTRPHSADRDRATAIPLPVKVRLPSGGVLEVGSAGVEVVGGERCYVLRAEQLSQTEGGRQE
jgi:hypothetical protein